MGCLIILLLYIIYMEKSKMIMKMQLDLVEI